MFDCRKSGFAEIAKDAANFGRVWPPTVLEAKEEKA
jgi:hypothetical protein